MAKFLSCLWLIATLFAAQRAAAVLVGPGMTVSLPGTSETAEPALEGTVVVDQLRPFSIIGDDPATGAPVDISGTVENRVVHASDHTYDFYWRVAVDPASSAGVREFHLNLFGDWNQPDLVYNVNYRLDQAGTVAPMSVARGGGGDTNPYGPADPMMFFFRFSRAIKPGEDSKFVFIDSKSHAYAPYTEYQLKIDDARGPESARYFGSFGPQPTPIPAALPMMLGALGTLSLLRRTRRTGRIK